jgi:hypothetical protein
MFLLLWSAPALRSAYKKESNMIAAYVALTYYKEEQEQEQIQEQEQEH